MTEEDEIYISTDIESAIIQGDTEAFDELVDDADLGHRSESGKTLLHKTIGSNELEMATELLD